MRQSESVVNLAKALAIAQGQFEAAKKDHQAKVNSKKGEGSSYSYSYADLASVFDAIREPLAANGLSFVQLPMVSEQNKVSVTTILLHSSGEFIESDPLFMPVNTDMSGAQAIGSAITYARRYSLSCILGIATEADDDGNAACGNDAATGKKEPLPACPKCGNTKAVIRGKPEHGGGLVCWKKMEGCGHSWDKPGQEPAKSEPPKPDATIEQLRNRLKVIGAKTAQDADAIVNWASDGKYTSFELAKSHLGGCGEVVLKLAHCGKTDPEILAEALK